MKNAFKLLENILFIISSKIFCSLLEENKMKYILKPDLNLDENNDMIIDKVKC